MDQPRSAPRPAERLKFFTDAVVAIALTLLILPLLEGVVEAAREGMSTGGYLEEASGQLLSFALSFALIASFWVLHHGLFEHVEQYTNALLWLNVAWMFTIVWLPVPTAAVGAMESDPAQKVIYIGTMLFSSLGLAAMYLLVRRRPDLWDDHGQPRVGGLAAALALAGLFALALLLALVVPGLDYLAMFVMFLTAPVQRLVARRLRPAPAPAGSGS